MIYLAHARGVSFLRPVHGPRPRDWKVAASQLVSCLALSAVISNLAPSTKSDSFWVSVCTPTEIIRYHVSLENMNIIIVILLLFHV